MSINSLASPQVKEGSASKSWLEQKIMSEIERLTAVLCDPGLTEEERSIAQRQIGNYRAIVRIGQRTTAEWLDQMSLLRQ